MPDNCNTLKQMHGQGKVNSIPSPNNVQVFNLNLSKMGKISQGILGGFSGKVGNVIGGNWKGIDYMRIQPASVANPRTEGQVDQRTKFNMVLQFLQPVKDFVRIGFKNYAIKMTAFNSAMSYNLRNAVEGDYPDVDIDIEAALISRGGLAPALNPTATLSAPGQVTFAWTDNSNEGNATAYDKAMVVVYNPEKKEAAFITDGVARDEESQVLAIPDSYAGDDLAGFISFISEDGKQVANSKFVEVATP